MHLHWPTLYIGITVKSQFELCFALRRTVFEIQGKTDLYMDISSVESQKGTSGALSQRQTTEKNGIEIFFFKYCFTRKNTTSIRTKFHK